MYSVYIRHSLYTVYTYSVHQQSTGNRIWPSLGAEIPRFGRDRSGKFPDFNKFLYTPVSSNQLGMEFGPVENPHIRPSPIRESLNLATSSLGIPTFGGVRSGNP